MRNGIEIIDDDSQKCITDLMSYTLKSFQML
jgi:hypothetical protein